MLLKDKVAVVYGAGGTIGSAVARAFAAEGATVFATGRTRATVDVTVKEILAAGGIAEAAELDVLDESAVVAHAQSVVDRAGALDVSFDGVGFAARDMLGVPLTNMEAEHYLLPVTGYAKAYFLIARTAARHMLPAGSGVIMTVTALPARAGSPLNGGYGPAQAAKEAMTRDLSHLLAPRGIRVIGIRPHGIPDSRTMADLYDLKMKDTMTPDQFEALLASTTHRKRGSSAEEVAGAAVFAASDLASGLSGTTLNLTLGALDD